MHTIEKTIFPVPSGNVRGFVTLSMPFGKKSVQIGHAFILVDKAAEVTLKAPSGRHSAATAALLGEALIAFAAEVANADASGPNGGQFVPGEKTTVAIQAYQVGSGSDMILVCGVPHRSGPDRWAVRRSGDVFNKEGQWEYEPSPSERDDAFMSRCRYDSPLEALAAARVAAGQRVEPD